MNSLFGPRPEVLGPLDDLPSGSENSYIATPVERHTRCVMQVKLANRDMPSFLAYASDEHRLV